MPTRRELLKATGMGIGAGAMAAAFPKTALARLFHGGGVVSVNPPQPTPAAAQGYNTLAFHDDFNSIGTIDVNNTGAPGYNWYPQSVQQDGSIIITPASDIVVSDSVLTLTETVNGGALCNMGIVGTAPSKTMVGNVINPQGCYYEARIKFPYTFGVTGYGPGWPSWWMFENPLCLAWANQTSIPALGYSELDFMEAFTTFPQGAAPQLGMADWVWYTLSSSGAVGNSNTTPNAGSSAANDNDWHTYGLLWVPQAKNGGTGLIKRYFDGVHQAACDVTYTTAGISAQAKSGAQTGWLSSLDANTTGFNMFLGWGENWPTMYDYVQVWA